mgnify:CR=1 FL=1
MKKEMKKQLQSQPDPPSGAVKSGARPLKMCKYINDPKLGKCPDGLMNCRFYHSKEALERAKAKAKRPTTRSPSAGKKGKGKGKKDRKARPKSRPQKDRKHRGGAMDVEQVDGTSGWGVPQGKSVHLGGPVDLIVEEAPSTAGGVTFGETEVVPAEGLSKSARRRLSLIHI